MRRILFLLFISIVSCSKNDVDQKLNANDQNSLSVDITVASLAAKNFSKTEMFNSKSDIKDNQIRKSELLQEKEIQSIIPHIDENGITSFYVVNFEGGGFVIISSTKASIPILAYDNVNSFRLDHNENDNIESWISFAEYQIGSIIENDINATEEISNEWEMLIGAPSGTDPGDMTFPSEPDYCTSNYEYVLPFFNIEWNQRCGFNYYMPDLSCGPCKKTLAGCVMVALGSVLKYYEYPPTYNWDVIPTTTFSDGAATIIKDIWDYIPSAAKSYTCSDTTIKSWYSFNDVLLNKFGYSTANYSVFNYQSVIQNLENSKPVILIGIDDNGRGGHMWVVDGYNQYSQCMYDQYGNYTSYYVANPFFHMNWGWYDTLCNGYYQLNFFNPDSFEYNTNLKMIYNITP